MPSFTPIYDRTKVMAGQAQVYLAPYSVASPAELPAESVALGGVWPATPQVWTPIGATDEGVMMAIARETEDITIEEQMTPVAVETTSTDVRFEAVLAEDTLATLKTAF